MEWISVEERLPEDELKKYLVKTTDRKLIPAFFMPDRAAWVSIYGYKSSHWMQIGSATLIYNVTHWQLLNAPLV